MQKIPTTTRRIHPIMALASVSVIVFCAAGTAAITGFLPTSKAGTEPVKAEVAAAAPVAQTQAAPQAAPATAPAPAPAAPVHHAQAKPVPKAAPQAVAQQKPAPEAKKEPNYVAMGAGAVIGGVLGNQVGGGNGRTLATVAGAIGGAMVGNEVAKSNDKK